MGLELTNSCTPGRRRWHLALVCVGLWQSGALPGPGADVNPAQVWAPSPCEKGCSPLLPLGGAGAVRSPASDRPKRSVVLPGGTDTAKRSLAVLTCPFSFCSLLFLQSVVCPR